MERWATDLLIATAGAVIGAVLLSVFQSGLARWGEERRKIRAVELLDWKSGDAAKRQRIFNRYLFRILTLFILGNVLIGLASPLADLELPSERALTSVDYIVAVMDAAGAVFYIVTLATILQFTSLVKQHP